jgi:IMP dehydrogenase
MGTIGHKLDAPKRSFGFDEIMLLPDRGRLLPKDIDISVSLGGIRLGVPLISAPMDSVTGSRMAIAMASAGGLGVIHRNCTIRSAVSMLRKVKEAEPPKDAGSTTLDSHGRLAVGAAISPNDVEWATALSKYADLLFVDVASFHNTVLMENTKRIMDQTGQKIVIGNLGTKEGVLECVEALGAKRIAAIKVGMGGGSICITTDVTGVGSPATFATEQAAAALEELGMFGKIPIIADGGIRGSRDIAISLGLGASAVMLGNMLVGCEESLAPIVMRGKKQYKSYWGMGSKEARRKRSKLDRYQDFAKGKEVDEGKRIYLRMDGKTGQTVERLCAKLRVSMGYVGAKEVSEMGRISGILVRTPKG